MRVAVASLLVVAGVTALGVWTGHLPFDVVVRRDRDSAAPAAQNARADERRRAAASALTRGIAALEREPKLLGGEVWFLQTALAVRKDDRLSRRVERAVRQLAGTREARLVDPTAPRRALPEYPGRGIIRLSHYLVAPIGTPEGRGVEFIRDFLSRDEAGYILTHQLLVLEWARTTGLDLPEDLRGQRRHLLERMAAEQAGQQVFTDLFVERTALLLAFASPAASDAARWVDWILREQRADGSWHDPKRSVLIYDGQRSVAMHTSAHTTGFAVGALIYFLAHF